MAAVAAMPTLSQIHAWDTTHLEDAAAHWSSLAWTWEDAFTHVAEQASFPGGTPWHGAGADAAVLRTGTDKMVVSGVADSLHSAAAAARNGAEDIAGARQLALDAVTEARSAGFTVGEDLSVTPPATTPLVRQAQLQAQAQVLATTIRTRAEELHAIDTRVAGQISTAVAGLNNVQFSTHPVAPPPKKPTIQAVDRTIKKDPPPPDPGTDEPWKNLPSPRTAQGVRVALRQLQRGANKPNRQLDTPEQIKDFFDWLTKNATGDLPPTGGFPRKVLEDGTEISLRPDSKSGGPTIEAVLPGPGKNPKVHLPLAPFINDPPQLPPDLDHPPITPPPEPGHPAPAPLPPTGIFDPNGLPPWLETSSPPGFAVQPVQPPTVMPGRVLASGAPPAGPPPADPSFLDNLGHDLAGFGHDLAQGAKPPVREFWPAWSSSVVCWAPLSPAADR